jgi:hypothetical protein
MMAKRSKFDLLDYVKIHREGASFTLELIVPLTKWPAHLYDKYAAIVRILTCPEPGDDLLEYPQHLALCRDVRKCPNKSGDQNNPSCLRNACGICCDATYFFNEGLIPCRALGMIHGYSAARVQQLQAEGAAKLRRLMMADPSMVEICQELRVGGVMPSVEEMAAGLGQMAGL